MHPAVRCDPGHYQQFAADYYGVELPVTAIQESYAHQPLTDGLVRQLNPETSLDALVADLAEIDYPRKAG